MDNEFCYGIPSEREPSRGGARIVAYADMFNLVAPGQPAVPNPLVVGTQVFVENLERLGLDWENLISVRYVCRTMT